MDRKDWPVRAKNAVALIRVLGRPDCAPHGRPKDGPAFPEELLAAEAAFWARRDNYHRCVFDRDPKIAGDFTLEVQVPKTDVPLKGGGCVLYPSSRVVVRDVEPWVTESRLQDRVWQKLSALHDAGAGPNRFDKALMLTRVLAAPTERRRRALWNTQPCDLYQNYIGPYGPWIGRYVFTRKTMGEVRRALRRSGLYRAIAAMVKFGIRALTRHPGH